MVPRSCSCFFQIPRLAEVHGGRRAAPAGRIFVTLHCANDAETPGLCRSIDLGSCMGSADFGSHIKPQVYKGLQSISLAINLNF